MAPSTQGNQNQVVPPFRVRKGWLLFSLSRRVTNFIGSSLAEYSFRKIRIIKAFWRSISSILCELTCIVIVNQYAQPIHLCKMEAMECRCESVFHSLFNGKFALNRQGASKFLFCTLSSGSDIPLILSVS